MPLLFACLTRWQSMQTHEMCSWHKWQLCVGLHLLCSPALGCRNWTSRSRLPETPASPATACACRGHLQLGFGHCCSCSLHSLQPHQPSRTPQNGLPAAACCERCCSCWLASRSSASLTALCSSAGAPCSSALAVAAAAGCTLCDATRKSSAQRPGPQPSRCGTYKLCLRYLVLKPGCMLQVHLEKAILGFGSQSQSHMLVS